MSEEIINIAFDRRKHPGIEFDIFPLEEIINKDDFDHNPKKLHRVNFYLILLVTENSGKHTVDFREIDLSEGSILSIRKDQIHKFHSSKAKGYILLFTEEFVVSYLDRNSTLKVEEIFNELLFEQLNHLPQAELEDFSIVISQIKAEFNQIGDQYSPAIIRSQLQVLINKLHRLRSKSSKFRLNTKYISQFLEFQKAVESKCTEHKSVQYYADQLNIIPKTLSNITKAVIGKSPKHFIDEVLILQIKRSLINSDLTIKEIAYNSGFDEPSNLFKFFKRHTEQTPEHFRAIYNGR